MTSAEGHDPARVIVDSHAHIGRTVSSGIGQSVADWKLLMDEAGIGRSILSVAAGGRQSNGLADTRAANDGIAAAVRADPERFPIGLASVEVRHGGDGLAEVGRALDELGLKGFAFHASFEGFAVDSDAFDAILREIGDRSALILVHSTPDEKAGPRAIGAVAERYPHLRFVLGHPVFTDAQKADAVAVTLALPNVSLDIAYQDDVPTIEYLVGETGAHRVLFGSDAPFFEPARVIAAVEAARITEADRSLIFAENALALIDTVT